MCSIPTSAHLQNPFLIYSATYSCADNLLFGCCLCAMLRTHLRARVLQLAPAILAVCTILFTYATFFSETLQRISFIPTLGLTLVGIACSSLIAMTLRGGSLTERLFRNRVLRFFGKYSYGLYVYHYSLDHSFTGPVRAFLNAHFHSKALAVCGGAIAITLASIAVSLVSYHFYEAPFLKLKKYFGYNKRAALPAS